MCRKRKLQCTKCNEKHEAPTGFKCSRFLSSTLLSNAAPESQSQAMASASIEYPEAKEDRMIQLLQDIKSRQDQLDERLRRIEAPTATSNTNRMGNTPLSPPSVQRQVNDFYNDGIAPTVQALRQSDVVQREVAARIQELEHNTGQPGNCFNTKALKSGRFWGADGPVVKNVLWPQELCFVGAARKTVSYDELSPLQFVVGFLKSIQVESSTTIKEHMIDYMVKLAQDGLDTSWNVARGANAIIYSQLEQNRLSWHNIDEIDRLRMLYTQRTSVSDVKDTQGSPQRKKAICTNFNNNRCNRASDHDREGITYRHICSYCFRTSRKTFTHAEVNCMRKQRDDGTGNPPRRDDMN